MLERYAFFKHLGFFPVDPHAARPFLRTTHALLGHAENALWLTPQGRFMDVRARPLRLQTGLGALAAREPAAAFLPLAIEYAFWDQPRPEILVSFGEPILPASEPARRAAEWTRAFTDSLQSAQNELAARSIRRDPADWRTLNRGASGVNIFYDAWRWLRGKKFAAEHG